MSNRLLSIYKKLGLNESNGLHKYGDEMPDYSSRIKVSLKSIDYDAIYNIDNKPLILFKEFYVVDESEIKDFHNSIWNFGETPVLFIVLPQEIRIYNGFIFDEDKDSLLKKIDTKTDLTEELDEFSFLNLISGNFWKLREKDFDRKKHVYTYLLKNLKDARAVLNDAGVPFNIIHNILGRLIFSRYLIDRNVLKKDFFYREYDCSFEQLILDKERLYAYFEFLKNNFNGDMFPLSKREKNIIKNEHLKVLNRLFNGDEISTGQTTLFNIYDFSIIPIELISNIYETFLDKNRLNSNKSFFTPLFLVDYILDKNLDQLLKNNPNCQILDPACGSGIFIVESLRRIIEHEIDHKGRSLTNKELKQILLKRIYGIDKDEDAINISIFSVYLTLLDYCDTKNIEEFKFPELKNKNLFVSDFFDLENEFNKRIKKVDLIVGNPPWGRINGLHLEYCKINEIPISYKEIAQSFLVRVKDFAKKDAQIALIVTSKVLYNLSAKQFRKYFLNHFVLDSILEFSPVRRKVFNNAIGPGTIVFYKISENQDVQSNLVEHTSLKPNLFFNMLRKIVIEKYDVKYIQQKYFIEYDWIWKVMLYGNIFDFYFIKRLKDDYKTIKDAVIEKSLINGVGIQSGRSNKPQDASHLFGKFYLDTQKRMLQRYFIQRDPNSTLNKKKVHRCRNPKLFEPPQILIKTTLNSNFQTIGAFSNEETVFGHSVMAIKGENEDKPLLKNILGVLNSRLFTYYIFATGSSTGVERGDVKEDEFLSFPMVKSDKIIDDVNSLLGIHDNKEYFDVIRDNANKIEEKMDNHLFNLFELNSIEKDLINYTTDISIPLFNGKTEPLSSTPKSKLLEYAQLFLEHFKYKFNGRNDFFLVDIYTTKYFIAINFKITPEGRETSIEFRNDENIQKIVNKFGILSIESIKDNLYIQKDIKGFEKSSFFVIKPNESKNWHKAVARLDISEFVDAMIRTDIQRGRGN